MAKKKTTTTKTKVETIKVEPIDITATGTTEETQTLEAQGLGDSIKAITSALGIKTCAKCEERRRQLNRLFPWLNASNMVKLEGDDVELMRRVIATPSRVVNDDVNGLFALYNRIYKPSPQIKRCSCPGLMGQMVERLTLLMEED